jgi:hypothetical protein
MLELKKAQRSKAYLRLGMSAPSGGGKTLGALLIGYGLMKEKYPDKDDAFRWSKIAIVDTENGSGELYVGSEVANVKIGEYTAVTMPPPFEADKYTNAIKLCQDAGIEVCIIDSTTHLWSGVGGLLEQQGNIAKRTGNSYTAWRDITPQHNRFVDAMLQSQMHIIATMRSKQEYVQEKDEKGHTTVRKVGLEPEQRKGMEYEFTTFFEIDNEHDAFGSKDRSSLFDQKTFRISPETGQKMMKWLMGGTTQEPVVIASEHKAERETGMAAIKGEIVERAIRLGGSGNKDLMAIVHKYEPSGNTNKINDEIKLSELRQELIDFEAQHIETKA